MGNAANAAGGGRSDVKDYVNQVSYKNSRRVIADVNDALQAYPKLQPGIGYHEDPNDGISDLLYLKGNLPICFRGRAYSVPITIWLLHHYPFTPPDVVINVNERTIIPPNRPDVFPNGKLNMTYFYDWSYRSLSCMLAVLAAKFSSNPPVFSLNRPVVSQSVGQVQPLSPVQQKLITTSEILATLGYQNTEDVLKHLADVFSNFSDLHPQKGCYNGQVDLVKLTGTIPSGSQRCLPVTIWIPQFYPTESPYVFIQTSDERSLVVSDHVACNGRVTINYIEEWDHERSNLLETLEILTVELSSISIMNNSEIQPSAPTVSSRSAEESLCKICMDKPRNVLFLLCRHVVCCSDCAEQVTECPICRELIVRRFTIFLA